MCASMRPGISIRPPASSTWASRAAIGFAETSRISPCSTSTLMPAGQSALWPSKTRAFLNSSWLMVAIASEREGEDRLHGPAVRRAVEPAANAEIERDRAAVHVDCCIQRVGLLGARQEAVHLAELAIVFAAHRDALDGAARDLERRAEGGPAAAVGPREVDS